MRGNLEIRLPKYGRSICFEETFCRNALREGQVLVEAVETDEIHHNCDIRRACIGDVDFRRRRDHR